MATKQISAPPSRFAGFEDVPLEITVRVGRARCSLEQLAALKPGDLIRLDRRIGDPFEMRVGGLLLARVEPVAEGSAIAVKLVEVPRDDDAADR